MKKLHVALLVAIATFGCASQTTGTSQTGETSQAEEVRAGKRMDWGGTRADVISPPPGELFKETNDNSVGILLTSGTARVLLAGDAEKRLRST